MGIVSTVVNYTLVTSSTNRAIDFAGIPPSYTNMVITAYAIRRHYLKVICGIGFPGNLAAILTIATVRPVRTATFLVALLAASDSAALLMKLVLNQLWYDTRYINDHYCRSRAISNVCHSFANWLLVLIGFERLVAVMLPVIRHRFLSKRRVYCICVVLILLIFSVHAPMIVGVEEKDIKCVMKKEMEEYGLKVWPWLNMTVYAFLPLLLLLGIALALFVSVRQAARRRRDLTEPATCPGMPAVARELRRSERAITSMALAASLFFIVMLLPQCLYFTLFEFTTVFGSLGRHTAKGRLFEQITYVLADSTHALNFYIYFVSVRRFRAYFWKMLRCQRTFCGPTPAQSSLTRSSKREGVHTNTLIDGGDGNCEVNGITPCADSATPEESSLTKN